MLRRGAFACVLLLTLVSMGPAHAAYGKATLLFTLQDPQIDESSGIASSTNPGVLFTHNDSEDVPPLRFFAVGPHGQTLATYHVLGAGNFDWEDMARGPGSDGTPSLYFADIGDNFHIRPFLTVYEVKEPKIGNASPHRTVVLSVASVTNLIYPDGQPDSETLLVHPKTGQLGVVTKEPTGDSGVYFADVVAPGIGLLNRVASIPFRKIARPRQPTDFDGTSRLLASGGAFSPDARRLVVRTYVEAFEWDVSNGVAAGLRRIPLRIPLPRTKQGEAITYSADGRSIITSSEQLPAPVHQITRR